MNLPLLDIAIIIVYVLATLVVGFWISSRASKDIKSYFLGGNKLSWWQLGLSNASGMFDISGTMWMVYLLFVYGVSSVYIPWLWPVFNQIFLMIFLATWLRRSGVMTGAEWITFRFGEGKGARLSHMIVVVFALVNVIGFIAYGFIGIGKFAAVFMPWELSSDAHLNDVYYGLIITLITTVYVVKGGMFSVVFTEVLQFFIMTIACVAVGIIAMQRISPELIASVVPNDWSQLWLGGNLDLDWSAQLAAANDKILADGYSPFAIFFMLVLFKGVLQSLAGPQPTYDMQRVLSAKTPKESAKMSGFVSLVLLFPRYMLITGLAVLAIGLFMPQLNGMGEAIDFEQILPMVLAGDILPSGLLGLLIAGLLAAFMSTFAATVNAAPAYVINDIYKRYINPNAEAKTYVRMSYLVSVLFVIFGVAIGFFIPSLNEIIGWIVSALYGGYTAANLLKWYWWRFNGFGYFWGMVTGFAIAFPLIFTDISPIKAFPFMFVACALASVLGSIFTEPDDIAVLKKFYLKVRPWGFWAPVLAEVQKDYPSVSRNKNFSRDAINVVIGIVWQTSLTAAPIFMVIQHWHEFVIAMTVAVATSIFLWFNWYKKLEDYPADTPADVLKGTNDEHLLTKT